MPDPKTISIASRTLGGEESKGACALLPGEIPGVTVVHHGLPAGGSMAIAGDRLTLTVLFLIDGSAEFRTPGRSVPLDRRASFIARPGDDVAITATGPTRILEIGWRLTEQDHATVEMPEDRFPLIQIYADCPQYRDYFKSEKTISRTIVGPHILPRFCMGSVESIGPDRIEPHAHPMLDQFFFSFSENDMVLLVDGHRHPLGGDTLLHVPLGSDHGVEVPSGKRMHYLWIDFFQKHEDMGYIAEVHKDVASRSF